MRCYHRAKGSEALDRLAVGGHDLIGDDGGAERGAAGVGAGRSGEGARPVDCA